MSATFNSLADDYDAGRIGYSNELYDVLAEFGLRTPDRVLDLGCGTGLASGPLVDRGFAVVGVDLSEAMIERARARYPGATWQCADARALPFEDGTFSAIVSAQALHHVGVVDALREMQRVGKPAAAIALWWKFLATQDPVRAIRNDVARELGAASVDTTFGGFKEFYAAPLVGQQVRVLPWQTVVPLTGYLAYERSRQVVRERLGSQADLYFARVEARVREHVGEGNPHIPLNFVQFLYLARTR